MIKYRLKRKDRIPRKTAQNLILTVAKYGNHYYNVKFKTDADVKRFFSSRGIDFNDQVEKCRDINASIPFENKIGSTMYATEGTTISRVDNRTGEEDLEISGPAIFSMSTYWTQYEKADVYLSKAIENIDYVEIQSAIVFGVASIESYIRYQAEEWNKVHPNDLLVDTKDKKNPFDDKINLWVPKMTGGKKLDKSTRIWNDFKYLEKIRDNTAVHAKLTGFGVSFDELANIANKFRTGIASLLIELHIIFSDRIPSIIIRGAHAPETEVIGVDDNN